jgi:hypothetical protein
MYTVLKNLRIRTSILIQKFIFKFVTVGVSRVTTELFIDYFYMVCMFVWIYVNIMYIYNIFKYNMLRITLHIKKI